MSKLNFDFLPPQLIKPIELPPAGVAFDKTGFFLCLLCVLFISYRFQQRKRYASYPPFAPYSAIETLRHITSPDVIWWMLRTHRKTKEDVFLLRVPLLPTMVAVCGDPILGREVFSDPETVKPESVYKVTTMITNGIPNMFATNGKFWHVRRKGVAPAFSLGQVNRMNAVAVNFAEKWIEEKLVPMINKGESFDVAEEMINVTLDAITATAFEYPFTDDEKKLFLRESELSLREFTIKSPADPFRRPFGLLLPERQRAFLASRRLHELSLKVIESYRNRENPIKGTIIDCIVTNDAYEDDDRRAADVTCFLIAGFDTTGFTLAWALKELAQDLGTQRKLREELRSLPKENQHKSELLKMTVKEALRLHPVIARGPLRRLGRDFTTKDGKILPKGMFLSLPFILFLRNENIFENPDKFDPFRWQNPTDEMNAAFIPFSFGKKNCVGQSLAKAELHCILPRILTRFEVTLEKPGKAEFSFTLKPSGTILRAKEV